MTSSGLPVPPVTEATYKLHTRRSSAVTDIHRPLAQWASSDLASDDPTWLAAGSPWWHLAYVAVLCGSAATAATLHEAVGGRRTRLLRVLAVLAVAAVACLGLAVAPDPARIPL